MKIVLAFVFFCNFNLLLAQTNNFLSPLNKFDKLEFERENELPFNIQLFNVINRDDPKNNILLQGQSFGGSCLVFIPHTISEHPDKPNFKINEVKSDIPRDQFSFYFRADVDQNNSVNVTDLSINIDGWRKELCPLEGDYLVTYYDINKTLLESCAYYKVSYVAVPSTVASKDRPTYLKFTYAYPEGTVKIGIKNGSGVENNIYLATAILADNVKDIPKEAFYEHSPEFDQQFNSIIKEINFLIDSGDWEKAIDLLRQQMKVLLEKNLNSSYQTGKNNYISLQDLQIVLVYSINSLVTQEVKQNSYYKVIYNDKKRLLSLLSQKKLENSNEIIMADLYLNSEYQTNFVLGEKNVYQIPNDFSGKVHILTYKAKNKLISKLKSEITSIDKKISKIDKIESNDVQLSLKRSELVGKKNIKEIELEKNKTYLGKIMMLKIN